MSIPPFWGDIGMKKWSPLLDTGAQSAIFGPPKIGTFDRNCQKCPKMGLQVLESKNKDHFFTPIYPQNGGFDIGLRQLPLLEEK